METLDEFRIGIMINDASYTDALYANGNQQCKVFIRVVKTIQADEYSQAEVAPLSPSERESLTVLPYSNELRPPQATGWSCDVEASDKFDEGLWRGTASVGLRGSTATTSEGANTVPEELYRYMRFDGRLAPLQPTTFMACITLDNGKQYTTHFDDGDKGFESSITIAPQRPYALHVSDMAYIGQAAYQDPQGNVTVDMYYWTLPGGLKIVNERFEGGYFRADLEWAYGILDGQWYREGMAVKVDVTTLTLGQIDFRISASYQNVQVPIINSRSMLRGARYAAKTSVTQERWSQDALMYWIITDNYGCESRFVLKANTGDKGNTMELLDG